LPFHARISRKRPSSASQSGYSWQLRSVLGGSEMFGSRTFRSQCGDFRTIPKGLIDKLLHIHGWKRVLGFIDKCKPVRFLTAERG
jgi:hypothetical protein